MAEGGERGRMGERGRAMREPGGGEERRAASKEARGVGEEKLLGSPRRRKVRERKTGNCGIHDPSC